MEISVQLRKETLGDITPKLEWRVSDLTEFSGVVFKSDDRRDCADWLTYDANPYNNYHLECVRKDLRPELSTYAKSLCKILLEKHGSENRLDMIKDIRAVYGVGLEEAKELIEDYLAECLYARLEDH